MYFIIFVHLLTNSDDMLKFALSMATINATSLRTGAAFLYEGKPFRVLKYFLFNFMIINFYSAFFSALKNHIEYS